MAKVSVYDKARALKRKSRSAIEKAEAKEPESRRHPSAVKARQKPKPSSMAPRKGGKRKHYGKAFKERKDD